MKSVLLIHFLFLPFYINGDTVKLVDIKKAIHGLGVMMEKTLNKSEAERKPVFELFTCLTLTKDLELLVFNRTEIFIEDEQQTCSCRRVHGKFGNETVTLSENSTFTTDLFIRMLIEVIAKYGDSDSLSQSFSHFDNNWLSSKKNNSHVHGTEDVPVKLTERENAIQILTRFVVKKWALNMIEDLTIPVFELYTCSSLLKEAENYVSRRPEILRYLKIRRGEWYIPCVCNRLYEIADSNCNNPQNCSSSFSSIHTLYEEKIFNTTKDMLLPPEITM